VRVFVQQKLHRARAHITRRLRQRHGAAAQFGTQRGRHRRAGGFFNDFLVPPLHRAVTLAQVDALAVGVGKHLHFHMARAQQGALDQQVAIAKTGQCF
jgi:hypothetical protein